MALVGLLFFFAFFGVWVAALIFWILKIVEVARIPDYQFRAAGSEKTNWILVVVLAQIIGGLIWQFAKRRDVLAAAGKMTLPPPGWYPEPGTGVLCWWDGVRWTGHRHTPPA